MNYSIRPGMAGGQRFGDAEGLAGALSALIAWVRAREAARPPIALPGPG